MVVAPSLSLAPPRGREPVLQLDLLAFLFVALLLLVVVLVVHEVTRVGLVVIARVETHPLAQLHRDVRTEAVLRWGLLARLQNTDTRVLNIALLALNRRPSRAMSHCSESRSRLREKGQ